MTVGSGCRSGRRPAARVAAGAVVTVTVTVTDIMMACHAESPADYRDWH